MVKPIRIKQGEKPFQQVRDAQQTKQQILNVAELEFAKHGLKGARLSTIADCACITTATIHYYFKNKEGLYRAVLQRPIDEVQTKLSRMNLGDLQPEDALKQIIRCTIAYEASNIHRQMLWFQEAIQNSGFYFKQSNAWNLYEHLLKVLERGMAEGCFRQLDPFITLTHILSVCVFYFTLQENWKHLTPQTDPFDSEIVEKHTKAAIEFILAGVKKTST